MKLTHVFFDIGGVLGTNGWDSEQRAAARDTFGLGDEFEERHHEVVGDWEAGMISLDEYLDVAVFFTARSFSRPEFVDFMREQSQPFEESLRLAGVLAARREVELMTLNNEAAELNAHRIRAFGLSDIFSAFLSSCWLGTRKPSRAMFIKALGIAQAEPESSLFIDDREQNLAPARRLGMRTHRFTGAAELEQALSANGLL